MTDQETKPNASITNINYDCLERIFDFMDLKDLLNTAQTCKRLQLAAAAKFGYEHGSKLVFFECEDDGFLIRRHFRMHIPDHQMVRAKISVRHNSVIVTGLKLQLPFLRCLGAKISHLHFEKSHCKIAFDQYINQYCADTLKSFTIRGRKEFTIEKPFENLENLVIENGDMNETFRSYINWYPNLRSLEMFSANIRVPRIRPLEHLEKLIIRNTDLADKLPCFVDWYPNLRHLEMHYVDVDTDYLAVSFPHLEHLGITMCPSAMMHIVNLLKANLQLQRLDILMTNRIGIATSFPLLLNMISAHQSISKFKVTLRATALVLAAELQQLANEHPLITELSLQQYRFTADDAVAFINQLKSLTKFEFCVENESQCKRIQDQLNDEWQSKYERADALPLVYTIVLNRNR